MPTKSYYALGLARRIEYATVVAFETVEKNRSLCRQTAMLNRVTDRVHLWPACDVASLASVVKAMLPSYAIVKEQSPTGCVPS